LFLVSAFGSGSYAVFTINNTTLELTPYPFDIRSYITYVLPYGYIKLNPSTCQSNEAFTEHTVMIETHHATLYDSNTTTNKWPGYGKPITVGSTSPLLLFKGVDGDYINNVYTQDTSWSTYTNATLLSVPRHPKVVDPDIGLIEQLKFVSDGVDQQHSQYLTGDGDNHIVEQLGSFSVLGKESFIGSIDPIWAITVDDRTTMVPFNDECSYGEIMHGWYWDGQKSSSAYKFGSVTLEEKWKDYIWFNYTEDGRRCIVCSEAFKYSLIKILFGSGIFKHLYIYDYDNINIDETFVCFYGVRTLNKSGYYTYADKYVVWLSYGEPLFGYEHRSGNHILFKMAWRCNNGIVHIEDIKYNISDNLGNYEGTPLTLSYALMHGDIWVYTSDALCNPNQTTTHITGTYGHRLVRFATKVTEKFMVYTYVVQEYTGPVDGTNHLYDTDDTYFTFVKRIIGVIKVETGGKIEYEITNEFLSDLYQYKFNKENSAAIGIHKLVL